MVIVLKERELSMAAPPLLINGPPSLIKLSYPDRWVYF